MSRLRGERGAAAVEFAFILIPLLLLVIGIFEFGRVYMVQLTMTNAARDAVRMYAVSDDVTRVANTNLTLAKALRLDLSGTMTAAAAATALDGYLDSMPGIVQTCDTGTPAAPGEVSVTLVRTESIFGFLTGSGDPLLPITLHGKAVIVCNG
ncbi:TadE/TadG family type IV pilus assembly protein [Agromyces mariniharenae]|uniref:Pilus assembly protein n=1 Tax=Agromyces mariniharenae TaxID=2604423 RepID=A0A5S4V2L2_9MICO|nr:TadE/TadG family type IV pilus assembly protein [Agromyces mariniharenae]TYL53196.1 pilus assembly protein [Agromyces mariniharenae]